MIKKIGLFFCFLCLWGCQAPIIEPFHTIDYRKERPIALPVQQIKIEDKTTRYTELPHLETRIPITPAFALKTALENRFTNTTDSKNTVNFVINMADLTQKEQVADHWYILNNIEYLLTYQIDVIYSNTHQEKQIQHLSGWEKQSLPKRSSLRDKEAAWQKMINAMIQKTTEKIKADIPLTFE